MPSLRLGTEPAGGPMESSEPLRAPRGTGLLRKLPWRSALLAGLGAGLTIAVLAEASALTELPLIIAPFGASCALVFGALASPLAHPRNVIGGHLISATLGLLAASLISVPALAMAVGVGLAIAGMLLTTTLHPPAGANPIVVVLTGASWPFLLAPVACGTVVIVAMGILYHGLLTHHDYVLNRKR